MDEEKDSGRKRERRVMSGRRTDEGRKTKELLKICKQETEKLI